MTEARMVKGARILLVDDEASYRQALARRLERREMTVLQAQTGEACLEILSHAGVDVVVLDMKMPGLSGMDTLMEIRKYYPDVAVIFLTGNAAVSDGVAGIKAGAFDYLVKPVEIDHLSGKIGQALQVRELEAARERDTVFRRRLEKRMIHTQRLASLGTMSTGIAHEINNPLAVIKESAGFMRQVLETGEDFPDRHLLFLGLEKIESSIDRAKRITHQLLGYVRKKGGGLRVTDLVSLVDDTISLVYSGMAGKQITMTAELDPRAGTVTTDPFQVRQVLINLLENAMDAAPEKGGRIFVRSGLKEGMICLMIEDNGCGMAPEVTDRIFDPFFTTKSGDRGTGLGLFVAHRIVENLKGTIQVESRPGKGSCFTVCLPGQEAIDADLTIGE